MKPVIGLIPLYDDEKESYWMLPGYMKVIEKCGGLPIMLPLTTDEEELEQAYNLCDGIDNRIDCTAVNELLSDLALSRTAEQNAVGQNDSHSTCVFQMIETVKQESVVRF